MPFRLPTGEEKAGYVRNQFDRIADRYDLTNDAISMGMHRFWKRAAVRELSLSQDKTYLDVCCGTGDLSMMIAERLSARGKVVGLDFSKNMLQVAERRAAKQRQNAHGQLEWIKGDAQDLPFDTATFDGAIISFGLRNLTDLQRGINEMARVVRPGGRVINLDLGHSNVPLFAPAFQMYFRQIVPIIGLVLQNDKKAYTYLPESLSTYPRPERLTEMFCNAGLVDVRHMPLAMGSVAMHVGTVTEPINMAPDADSGGKRSLFVMVGDLSADKHAAKLIKKLHELDPSLQIWGAGGPEMLEQGMERLYNCQEFAVFGIIEVLKQIPFFAKLRSEIVNRIAERKPNAVLLMDFGGFNLSLAGVIRQRFPDLPIVYFISPQVWGSRPWRMNKIAKTVSKMLVIFPFEENVYRSRGIPVRFVGHPLTENLPAPENMMTPVQFRESLGIDGTAELVGVFPGSRNTEITNLLPLALDAIDTLLKTHPGSHFVISQGNAELQNRIRQTISKHRLRGELGRRIKLIDSNLNYELMANADVIWAKSGTTALEVTLFGTPMMIFYRGLWLSFLLFLAFKQVKRVAWPNLLAGKQIVPELIQLDCRAEQLVRYTNDLLGVPALRREIRQRLLALRSQLGQGDYASNCAEEILAAVGSPGERWMETMQAQV